MATASSCRRIGTTAERLGYASSGTKAVRLEGFERYRLFSPIMNDPLQSSAMRGIEIEVVWSDQDVIEHHVRCSNGLFCGDTRMYSGRDDLRNTGDVLSGFPLDAKDSRTIELGTFDVTTAGGGVYMRFYCVDSVGHAAVLVKLRADGCKSMGEAQSVCFYLPVEAGAIDSFVTQARSIGSTIGAKAYLHMADHTVG